MRVGGGMLYAAGRGGGGGGGGGGEDPVPGGRLHAQDIGDGVNVEFEVDHSFGTRDVIVNVYSNDSDDDVDAEVYHDSPDVIRVVFMIPPNNNEFRCVVLSGFGGEGGGGGGSGDYDPADVEITGGYAIGLTSIEGDDAEFNTLNVATTSTLADLELTGTTTGEGTYTSGDMVGGLAKLSHLAIGGIYRVTESAGAFVAWDDMGRNAVGTGIIIANQVTIDSSDSIGGTNPHTSLLVGPRAGGFQYESTYASHYFTRQGAGIALQDQSISMTVPPVRTTFIAANGTKCTVITEVAHGFHVGEEIQMMNHADDRFNGRFEVTDVDSTTQFKFALAVSAGAGSPGFVGVPNAIQKGIGVAMCGHIWAYGADVEPFDFGEEHVWASSFEDNPGVWAIDGGNFDLGRRGVTAWTGLYSYPYWVVAAARATIQSISRSGDNVTLNCSAPHGMVAGMRVYINDCVDEDFKGRWLVEEGGGYVTGATRGSGNAVYTTDRPHGLEIGDVVTISGMDSTNYSGTPSNFNQSNKTLTAVTSTTFTFALAGGSSSATSTTNERAIASAERMLVTELHQYRYAFVTRYSGTGGVCTCTTDLPHGFEVGDEVGLNNFDEHHFFGNRNDDLDERGNGTFTITDVDTYTFSFALAGSPDPTGVAISSKHWGGAFVGRDVGDLSGHASSVTNLASDVGEVAWGRVFVKRRVASTVIDSHTVSHGGDVEEEVYYYAPITNYGNAKRKIGLWNGLGEVREPALTPFDPEADGLFLPVNQRYLLVNNTNATPANVVFDIDNAHDGQIVLVHVIGFPINFTDGFTVDLQTLGNPVTWTMRQGAMMEFICYGGTFRPVAPNTGRASAFEARIVSGGGDGSYKSFLDNNDTQPAAMLGSAFGFGGIFAGPGGTTATDTSLYRSAAATWLSNSKVNVTTGTTMSQLAVDGLRYFADDTDTQPIAHVGTAFTLPGLLLGPGGSSAVDATLLRAGSEKIQVGSVLVFPERSTNPTDPAAGVAFQVYMKGDKLVFAFQTAGNVMHYFTLDGTATSSQSLVYSASAP